MVSDTLVLTTKQLEKVYDYAYSIIKDLPPAAVNELLEGYEHDQDRLINEIFNQVNNVLGIGRTLDSEKLDYITSLEFSMDSTLKKLNYNYFKTTCLPNFRQNSRNLEWGNLAMLYPYLAILAARSHGKCESPDTEVVMYDGTLKQIKDIEPGDMVMGVDGSHRMVISVHSGEDDMYEVIQNRSENYTVNSEHLIHFKRKVRVWNNSKRSYESSGQDEIINMSAKDFHEKSDYWKTKSMGYRVEGWELEEKEQKIDPYFLGLWLADGNSNNCNITNPDFEVIDWIEEYVKTLGLNLNNLSGVTYSINKRRRPGERNKLLNLLRSYNLIDNKHIPDNYLYGSKQQRLRLLAGLIDGDGHYNPKDYGFEFALGSKYSAFAKQIQYLCWSLGFRCSYRESYKKLKYKNNFPYLCHCLRFSGYLHRIPTRIKRKQAPERNRVKDPQKSSLKTNYLGRGKYCGITLDGDNLYLGKDGTVKHNSYEFVVAYALWKLYSYDRPNHLVPDTIDNKNRKETLVITNTHTLGQEHVSKIVEEIKFNDILSEKLNPRGKASLNVTGVTTETGSKLHLRGVNGFFRGLHTGTVICDDMPDESSIYSQDQRDKLRDLFYGGITPIVEPYGNLIVSGTPYHQADIFSDIKKDKRFKIFEYPAVFPDGSLLSPDRFTFDKLEEERQSLGTLRFTREYLVVPISDDATIFPYDYLKRGTIGMENISYVDNVDQFPIKMRRVVVGCDFAVSGDVGSDYTVYTVWGVDNNGVYYLMHIWRKRGASYLEQINQIVSLNQRFRANKVICESNGFQKNLSTMARERGMKNIEEFNTTSGNKKSWEDGLPSMSAMFERGILKMPYKDGKDRETTDMIFGEFNSIGVTDKGKLESNNGHDDTAMSSLFAVQDLRENKTIVRVDMV